MTTRAALLRRQGTTPDGRNFLLRPTAHRDAQALVDLQDAVAGEGQYIAARPGERSAVEETLTLDALLTEGGLSIVVEMETALVGHLIVHRRVHEAHPDIGDVAIVVANGYRRQGLGRLLMETAIEWARLVGLRTLSLAVFATNEPAISLYRALGFKTRSIQPARARLPASDRELLLMELPL